MNQVGQNAQRLNATLTESLARRYTIAATNNDIRNAAIFNKIECLFFPTFMIRSFLGHHGIRSSHFTLRLLEFKIALFKIHIC
jgi:hypothetical protein